MNILRKTLGVFLLVFSFYLAYAFLISLLNQIDKVPTKSGPERYGQITGTIIFSLLMIWLLYFIAKKAIKLFKNKPQSEIEEIGQL